MSVGAVPAASDQALAPVRWITRTRSVTASTKTIVWTLGSALYSSA
jgi:hypothetical protein